MGLFKKSKGDPGSPGKIGVKGMGPLSMDPALLGGPSTKPLAADDPMLAPVDGVSLEMYAYLAQQAQARGVTDEAGLAAIGEEVYQIPAATVQAALAEWVSRMQKSMVVGQQFNKLFLNK